MLFNGTNSDPASKAIYKAWLERHKGQEAVSGSPSADMRSALVEEFKDRASVMIATESAAEGVNLQFCNLVVNYDLPWNPQRIEQRIGRCHRYGQQHDVVVVNFLNRANQADARVFELLDEKLRLFDGVFGASDEVLGALESGIDFEKMIHMIYQTCRTPQEINEAFDRLQRDLETQIASALTDAREKLLENFDDDVQRMLKVRSAETKTQLDRYGGWLWSLTRIELEDAAAFDTRHHAFRLDAAPSGLPDVPAGTYRLVTEKVGEGEIHYRAGHPLAQALIDRAAGRPLPPAEVEFYYNQYEGKLSLVEMLRGKSGWLRLLRISVSALETEDTLVFCGVADDGQVLDRETCEKLMAVPGKLGQVVSVPPDVQSAFSSQLDAARGDVMGIAMARNQRYYEAEMEKLDAWAEDCKGTLEREIRDLEESIRDAKKQARLASDLAGKIALQKRAGELERQRNARRRNLFEEQDRSDAQRLVGLLNRDLGQMTRLVGHLNDQPGLYDIDAVVFEDRIEITLYDDGVLKPVGQLSKGQMATALLPLILRSADYPLIFDQPEDDLDNRFVFKTLVEIVRKLKLERQLIFVTHNANIPVLGEADRVIVMQMETPLRAAAPICGPVDEVKEHILNLLEGGREAFRLRQQKYQGLLST